MSEYIGMNATALRAICRELGIRTDGSPEKLLRRVSGLTGGKVTRSGRQELSRGRRVVALSTFEPRPMSDAALRASLEKIEQRQAKRSKHARLREETAAWAKRQQSGGGVTGGADNPQLDEGTRKFLRQHGGPTPEQRKATEEAERQAALKKLRFVEGLRTGNMLGI